MLYIMLYEELCNKYYNVKYYEDCIKIKINSSPNNKYDIGNLFFAILEIFKLDKVDMDIEFNNKILIINNESDIKSFFKNL